MVEVANASAMLMYNVTTFNDYWLQTPEFRLHWLLKAYCTPMLIIAGSIGNITSAVILYRHHSMWQHSVYFYMFVYALLNTLVLNLAFGLNWLPFIASVHHLMELADWTCRVWQFVSRIITYYPAWIIVAMMVDRVAAPSSSFHHVCTTFMAQLVTVLIFIGLIVISIHSMWMYELINGECDMSEIFDFLTIVWPWIAATFYSYIPFITLLILNVILCVQWCHIMSYSVKQHQFTRATLVISVSYILCSFPTLLINFINRTKPSWLHDWHTFAQFLIVLEVSQLLVCFHHSITFVIYFSTISMFRCSLRCDADDTTQPRDSVTDMELHPMDVSESNHNEL
ncbi:hypothetical protein LSAT2_022410 [Lamellibrachia satsuma]|nr:hypothetical protein LSAT2_022410 [Lamellibrachia satsuma]